jgi:hypothetical protein
VSREKATRRRVDVLRSLPACLGLNESQQLMLGRRAVGELRCGRAHARPSSRALRTQAQPHARWLGQLIYRCRELQMHEETPILFAALRAQAAFNDMDRERTEGSDSTTWLPTVLKAELF